VHARLVRAVQEQPHERGAGRPKSVYSFVRAQEIALPTSRRVSMSDEYDHGRRDGLRLALAILEAEEAKWEALLGQSRSGRTNIVRTVRHKTLQVAQKRLQTALHRLTPKGEASISDELASALDKIGL
jgi:hypothetical protein